MQHLHLKKFRNEFVSNFPGDESGNLNSRQTPGMLYSKALPTPVKCPTLLAWSETLAKTLEIQSPDEEDIKILGGNLVSPSMYPYAACYAGHQFGNWAGQLGDGRAITLGEWETSDGASYEMQLKGAGPTPYSRRADGRAVLRSSVREYLMSEAMFHLGVPTTRALSLVSTGEKVIRDMFYDGHPEYEAGAIVMRVAPSFLRFGNFEMLASREEIANLRKLADWTIQKFYPHISMHDNKVIVWFREVLERTATMIVEWLRVGFVHGVMNTDNMSVLGLTIDYGPYSFLDDYDRNFTPNTTDLPGRRYAFGKQASIAHWNLGCLAGAIAPLCNGTDELVAVLDTYEAIFWDKYYLMMGNKLGLDQVGEKDITLITDFEDMMASIRPDMTIFYQLLIDLSLSPQNEGELKHHFRESFYHELTQEEELIFRKVMNDYIDRIKKNNCSGEASAIKMRKNNPGFILRNYLLHQAAEALEQGDNTLFMKLQEALLDPYTTKRDAFFVKRPDWAAQKAGCSMLSCSS
jgi:uncharacterized protein YdiU (UPF0061 family)